MMCGRSPDHYRMGIMRLGVPLGSWEVSFVHELLCCPQPSPRAPSQLTTLKSHYYSLLNVIGNYMHENLSSISTRSWGRVIGRDGRVAGQRNTVHHFQGACTWQWTFGNSENIFHYVYKISEWWKIFQTEIENKFIHLLVFGDSPHNSHETKFQIDKVIESQSLTKKKKWNSCKYLHISLQRTLSSAAIVKYQKSKA